MEVWRNGGLEEPSSKCRFGGLEEKWQLGLSAAGQKRWVRCLSSDSSCGKIQSMAKKKTTGLLPEPPPGEERVALHIDIPGTVNWRIKMALLIAEGEGKKVTKKNFVEEAIIKALDNFDNKRARK